MNKEIHLRVNGSNDATVWCGDNHRVMSNDTKRAKTKVLKDVNCDLCLSEYKEYCEERLREIEKDDEAMSFYVYKG